MNVILNDRLAPASYRSVFVSDVHLGTRDCRADLLAEFLRTMTCERLYLVGDIIDGWKLKRSWFWNSHHDDVLNLILRMGRSGTEIIYIPGNHDEMFRRWLPHALEVAGIRLCGEAEHVTATGRKFLVLHGDEFDSVVRYAPFLAMLGDRAYTVALVVNRWFNLVRRRLGLPYRSLSQWLKRQVKSAVMAIDRFETAVADEARRRGMDGVVCGHIHHAVIKDVDGVLYMNDGDWVESCSALVEHHDGSMELLDVTDVCNRSPAPAPLASGLFAGA
ncbi:UDP-2,3-diacylglucosamine diphosphatase [Gluconacetobacter takamatsuzukensis]|uniref:UDP-2,3-diacylglucosamine diphosphatase n=1 Tax=Gluconacetobacter takamatsuzukensis TaxID=1286190 RepID=A0A7W4PMR9_9PROT|nr:UDP-2,3-diacylglucosamine diphosphatase [Gluconacetobacter takamatsuzukensis]MBB2203857.1 UDP-2,3-diacylglucosamine diphosphatase [Gluconacetobacter takamatsuzukensis]